jgi:hypothetical protein
MNATFLYFFLLIFKMIGHDTEPVELDNGTETRSLAPLIFNSAETPKNVDKMRLSVTWHDNNIIDKADVKGNLSVVVLQSPFEESVEKKLIERIVPGVRLYAFSTLGVAIFDPASNKILSRSSQCDASVEIARIEDDIYLIIVEPTITYLDGYELVTSEKVILILKGDEFVVVRGPNMKMVVRH